MGSYPALRVTPQAPSAEFADLVAAALDDFDLFAMEEMDDGAVSAFFVDGRVRDAAAAAVLEMLPGSHVESVEVPDENWAARSQASLRAIRAGALTVAPPWDVDTDAVSRTIIIVPSMGFGTGHHATTRLCLEALQTLAVGGKAVIDVGTGSGVLAIAAAKLGAARVLAIDNDPDAIANARENVALNALRMELRCASIDAADIAAGESFDVVLANLTGATLARFASVLGSVAGQDSALILSGLREDEEKTVRNAFEAFESSSRRVEDGWVCLVMRRSQA